MLTNDDVRSIRDFAPSDNRTKRTGDVHNRYTIHDTRHTIHNTLRRREWAMFKDIAGSTVDVRRRCDCDYH